MITDKTVKAHKDQSDDGFCHCGGSVRAQWRLLYFPRDYEKNREYAGTWTAKCLSAGRVSAEDEKASKLICEKVIPFETDEKGAVDSVSG